MHTKHIVCSLMERNVNVGLTVNRFLKGHFMDDGQVMNELAP